MVVVRLSGEFDLRCADEVRERLEALIDAGHLHLALNLKGVTFIDSSGLGVLLGRYRRLKQLGGRLVVVGATPAVRRILEMSGLLSLLDSYGDESEVAVHG